MFGSGVAYGGRVGGGNDLAVESVGVEWTENVGCGIAVLGRRDVGLGGGKEESCCEKHEQGKEGGGASHSGHGKLVG